MERSGHTEVAVSYRAALHTLDASATPAPWVAEGEFYGVVQDGRLRPIGFAPHHTLDPVLIASYRNHLGTVLGAVGALGHHLRRATRDRSYAIGEAVTQVLDILDAERVDGLPLTSHLMRLDKATTQPLWDPGHLAMAMDILREMEGVERFTPAPADALLIAAARSAIPRALALFTRAATALPDGGGISASDGTVAQLLLDELEDFDRHRVDEGMGVATV